MLLISQQEFYSLMNQIPYHYQVSAYQLTIHALANPRNWLLGQGAAMMMASGDCALAVKLWGTKGEM